MATEYCLTYKYTGQSNVHNSMIVAKSKFTLSGDTTKKIGKITRITYQHTHTSTNARTWKLYGKLYFADGTTLNSDTVSKYISGDTVNYLNTFSDNLPTPAQFATWKQIQTVAANPSSSIDIYWRATSEYPMYVKVYFEEAGASITDESGNQVSSEIYVWKTTNPTTYYYPPAAMTANSSQGCAVSASSVNSSYPVYQAFNKTNSTLYSGNSKTPPGWIQITMPKALYNIKVTIQNRASSTSGAPVDGIIYGSNDGGTTLTQIGSFSGRDHTASFINTITCTNTTVAYNTVRLHVTSWYSSTSNLVIGDMYVSGTDIGSNGGWIPAQPLVWKTENPITYTYPKTAMKAYISGGCFACASTEGSSSTAYHAWKAFNKATSSTDMWFNADGDTEPWLQLTMPRPLYNISVQIYNRFSSDDKGPIDGIIYGSNDCGTTLTQIGSFAGRDPTYGTNSTVTCTNTTTAYNTVRLRITKWGDANGNPRDASTPSAFGVGAMFITGTDIGTNGGWASLEGNDCGILQHPKSPMTSNTSQDCIVSASSCSNTSSYPVYQAFDLGNSTFWSSTSSDTDRWIQIIMPEPLYNMNIRFINRASDTLTNPASGIFYGSNDNGTTWTQIGSFSNRPSGKGLRSTHTIGNTKPYSALKIAFNSWYVNGTEVTSGGNTNLAYVCIYGTKKP